MEEKIQSVQYRDSEPSEFAHKPPKQEMATLTPQGACCRGHRLPVFPSQLGSHLVELHIYIRQ